LHGDERGSVDPKHNKFGTPRINANPNLQKVMRSQCAESAFILNKSQRETVLQSIINTAQFFKWNLIGAHIRSNHVHVIVQSTISKEKTMAKLKAYATQELKKQHAGLQNRNNFWVEHGSTENIWIPEELFPAFYYVVEQQGKPMALYYNKELYDSFDPQLYKILMS
jgi:REP element-mobilizing transposase RayT